MQFKRIFILILLGICGSPPSSYAGTITIHSNLTTVVEEKMLKCSIEATNGGTQSAYHVRAEISMAGHLQKAPIQDVLPVGGKYTAQILIPLDLASPGQYPVNLTIGYADASGHPFSSLLSASFPWQEKTLPSLFGTAKDIRIDKNARGRVILKNLDERPHAVRTSVVVPKEFQAIPDQRTYTLKGRTEAEFRFRLKNFSALPGSSYPIWILSEYDEEGKHYLVETPVLVSVVDEDAMDFLKQPYIYYGIVCVVGLFLIGQIALLLK